MFTIGHSTRTIEAFVALLVREHIAHLADIRTFPASRRHPHFNRDALRASLESHGIRYSHHAALGGRRRARPDSRNGAWRNESFRGYADHMETAEFENGVRALLEIARAERTVAMCAEAVPWRCHRSLLSDALVARGIGVEHIMDGGVSAHQMTKFAVVTGEGRVSYRDAVQAAGDSTVGQVELFEG
ncbi:MAG: DUF488 domain-containing protein [Gemmatimonadota bacterium]|nr:DUF488 domain-containing protein [Gemmatimonadota bacterium]